jgi:hypothetical protein
MLISIQIFLIFIQNFSAFKSIECSFNKDERQCNCQINSPIEVICRCDGSYFDIRKEFEQISENLTENNEKHFQSFNLFSAKFEEFPENSFKDITFDYISVINPINLSRINTNAFNNTASKIKRFYLWGDNLGLVNDPSNNDLWQAFSSLINLEYLALTLGNGTVHEIPDYAFKVTNGPLNHLIQIDFMTDNWFGYNISKIGDYAFFELPNLQNWIVFTGIPIAKISSHAFDFKFSHNSSLRIDLSHCNLNEYSFESKAFSDAKRPLYLNLSIINNKI